MPSLHETLQEVLRANFPTARIPDEPEIKVDERGRRYIDGKNGKRWPLAPLPYHDADLARSMSAVYYGYPPLNPAEQAVYDLVWPILNALEDRIAEEIMEWVDSFRRGELPAWPTIKIDPDGLAYEIAELVVERATKESRDDTSGEDRARVPQAVAEAGRSGQ